MRDAAIHFYTIVRYSPSIRRFQTETGKRFSFSEAVFILSSVLFLGMLQMFSTKTRLKWGCVYKICYLSLS